MYLWKLFNTTVKSIYFGGMFSGLLDQSHTHSVSPRLSASSCKIHKNKTRQTVNSIIVLNRIILQDKICIIKCPNNKLIYEICHVCPQVEYLPNKKYFKSVCSACLTNTLQLTRERGFKTWIPVWWRSHYHAHWWVWRNQWTVESSLVEDWGHTLCLCFRDRSFKVQLHPPPSHKNQK